jgi:zinc-binding alcohol dehydrogenase/oxidoreductase
MKAVVLEAVNQVVTIKEVATPQPAAGEAVVQLKAAALNHRDVFIQQGRYPGIKVPIILGSDGSGVVSAVGEGVADSLIGQEVIINCSHNWGENERFNAKNYKILGLPDDGTFAEYIKVEAKYLVPKPAHLSFEAACQATNWRKSIDNGHRRRRGLVDVTVCSGHRRRSLGNVWL